MCASAPFIVKADLPGLPQVPWSPRGVDQDMAMAVDQACRADKKQFCADVQVGNGRIFNCLWSQWVNLSEECRQASLPLWKKAAGSQ
jgi:hypothetical protein